MIPLNFKKCNSFLANFIEKIDKVKNYLSKDINQIKTLSPILEVSSITKSDNIHNNFFILYIVLIIEYLLNTNSYTSFRCPFCKHNHCLTFHKTYKRTIIFCLYGYEITASISLIVLECSFCKNNKKSPQHYHALIPDGIFPYHIYSGEIILDILFDRMIHKIKVQQIIEKNKISHQLYYQWIKEFVAYQLSSSIILNVKNDKEEILLALFHDPPNFFLQFFIQYYHPFFLFRKTCVSLAITS